jgi:hypothetical protein
MDAEEQRSLARAVKEVSELEARHREAAAALRARPAPLDGPGFLEPRLLARVTEAPVQGRVAAVDGGVLSRELHGLDIVLARAVGVAFDYEGGRKLRAHYYPRARPGNKLLWRSALEAHDAAWLKGLARLEEELSCALATLESLAPDALLLDGSVVPQASDKPGRESPLAGAYDGVAERWRALYAAAEKRGTLLLGVVKDSRGSRFTDLLVRGAPELGAHREALLRAHDSLFLAHLLEEGERTCFFRYASAWAEPLVLRDLGPWASRIASTYLRPSRWDRPLRVDALLPAREGDYPSFFERASMLVHSLARINTRYAMPAVSIEADLRARGEERDLDAACATLEAKLGVRPALYPLRRASRPFG